MVRRTLIAASAVLLVAIAASVAVAAGPPLVSNRKFDHDRHAASAAAKGRQADCASCHDDNKQKPNQQHARCAGCHTYPNSCTVMKTSGPGSPARLCRTCHVPTRKDCLPKDMPPLPTTDSFSPKFTHTKHLGLGGTVERDCGLCHSAQVLSAPTEKPHAMCSGCHNPNGAKPSMADCAGCHVAPTGKAPPTGIAANDPFRLASFDHRTHANATQQNACLSCHDKPTGDTPKASMLGCQTRCHDGQKTFSATGTHCTMCHKASAPAQPTPPALAFSHAEHLKRNVKIDDCAQCHVLDTDGTVTAPLARKDHQPCANSGCHQTEYLSRTPKICGVCHESAVPWAKTASRPGKQVKVEWFESMNHASHLSLTKATCEGCHGDKRTGGEAPHGHRACASCHAHGAAPAITDCKSCHSSNRQSKIQASEWNVSATFEHTKHSIDPRSHKATACTECHTKVAAAKDMASVTAPKMADCDGCHNGKIVFKTTGFGCALCHGPKIQASLQPSLPSPLQLLRSLPLAPSLSPVREAALEPAGGRVR